jgi:hypothetical protein
MVVRTSTGNFPPIQTSWAAYICSFRMPLACGSRDVTASLRSPSMISRSRAKVSGCWSYFVEMYDLIASERSRLCVRRKGMGKMLLLPDMLAGYVDGRKKRRWVIT